MFKTGNMRYRNLGNSGLKVSVISFGTFTNSETSVEEMVDLLRVCLENGINYFDTALSYVEGKIAQTLGEAFKKLGVDRENFVISTKIYSSPDPSLNSKSTLCRKHIRENLRKTLTALQMDYIDIALAHTYDEDTGIEEVCRGFHEAIEDGDAFYWGTSNWDADQVMEAISIC